MIHYIMNAVFLCLKLMAVKTIMNVLLLPKSIAVGEGPGQVGIGTATVIDAIPRHKPSRIG